MLPPDGAWQHKKKETVKLASDPVTWLLALGHDMWAASGRDIHVINVVCKPPATTLSVNKVGGLSDTGCKPSTLTPYPSPLT